MEFIELLEKRRSVRAYKENTTIEKSVVEKIINAAQQAPSWKNSQTARYYVVMSPEKLAEVRSECLPEFNQKNSANAPVLIVTAFSKSHSGFDNEKNPVNELGDKWGAYDLGLQNEALILKATDLGLDTLIMGIRNSEKLRELLNIPDTQEIVSVIALGYRATEPIKPKRKELEEISVFY